MRNRADGSVEALMAGDTPVVVEEMLRQCRLGPAGARVVRIMEELVAVPDEHA